MKSIISEENLQELSFHEASEVNGGESLWYWIAYAAGAAVREAVDTYEFYMEHPIAAAHVSMVKFI